MGCGISDRSKAIGLTDDNPGPSGGVPGRAGTNGLGNIYIATTDGWIVVTAGS